MATVKKKQISQEMMESASKQDAAEAPDSTSAEVQKEDSSPKDPPKENGDSAAEAVVTNGEANVNGTDAAAAAEKKADEQKSGDAKKKKKKVIPSWATLPKDVKDKMVTKNQMTVSKGKLEEEVVEAIQSTGDSKGVSSANTIRKFIYTSHPNLPKFMFKKAMKKALEKNLIKQMSGKGISGSFKVNSAGVKAASKSSAKAATNAKSEAPKKSLDEIIPDVFTWVTYPKEASVNMIKKYLKEHYPDLNVDGNEFKKALETGIKKGQLERITGKGNSGTMALVDGADKTGNKYEDPFESAIIAMNEPKECSVYALRDYLSVYHKEYKTDDRPRVLKNALDRLVEKGWLTQITGKGFSGSFRLNYPYYPSPRQLWGAEYKEAKSGSSAKASGGAATRPKKTTKRQYKDDSSDEEESEDESDSDESDAEVMPTPKRRGGGPAPAARGKKAPTTVWNPKFRATAPPPPKMIKPSKKKAPAKKPAAKKGGAAKKKAAGKGAAAKKPAAAKNSAPPKPIARKSRA